MSTAYQVVWEKFCQLWQIEMRTVPIAGVTWTGMNDDIEALDKALDKFNLSVVTLAIMNITAVVSLRGLPAEAIYGPSSAFYYLFAAIVFLIPTAMVAAELAAMFSDKQGGVFRWVGEAFGARTDCDRKQHSMVQCFDCRMYCHGHHTVHHLRYAQTVLARSGSRICAIPLGRQIRR